jgi:Aspartyl protease
MRNSALVAFMILSGIAVAGTAQAQSCSAPQLLNSVAMTQIAGSNLMAVPISINGTARKFVIDTGDVGTEVSQAMVRDLGLPENTYSGQAMEYNVKGSHSAQDIRQRVRVADFQIGNMKGSSMQFLISSDQALGDTKPYDGLLANDLFNNYDLDLDFAAKRMNYFSANHCPGQVVYWPEKPVAVVPVTIRDSKITVPVTIDGHQIDAVIDTSADRTVMKRGVAEQTFNLDPDSPQMTPVEGLRDGLGERVYTHTFGLIGFEGVAVNNLPVLIQTNSMVRPTYSSPTTGNRFRTAMMPPIPDLSIGMDVLSHLHVYIAFAENKLYVSPAGNGDSALFKGVASVPAK